VQLAGAVDIFGLRRMTTFIAVAFFFAYVMKSGTGSRGLR
jgi:hypothetical protein